MLRFTLKTQADFDAFLAFASHEAPHKTWSVDSTHEVESEAVVAG